MSKENKELRTLLDNINKESVSKDDVIKSLEDKEGNLIATADHTINSVNFWLTFLGVFITVLALLSAIAPYLINKPRIDKLEKDIEKYKLDIEAARNELNTSKDELSKSTKLLDDSKLEFETVKSKSDAAAECAVAAERYAKQQFEEVDGNYNLIKREMEKIRDEVMDLAEKAKESEDNAKKSEDKAKASEYFSKAYSIKGDNIKSIKEQIDLYSKAIESDNRYGDAYYNRGNAYSELGKLADKKYYNNALNDLNKCIDIEGETADTYNSISMAYRRIGDFDKALLFVEKSLAIDSNYGLAYSTKAEIFAEQGEDDNKFYEYIELALKNDCPVWEFIEKDEVYKKYKNESRFIELIDKYKNIGKS